MARRALISVSDKSGVVDFAASLIKAGWEVIATGGTMKLLRDSGLEIINISDITGFPEICDGRVKTLHPNIHGGILARRDVRSHVKELKINAIDYIDLVCVNLYPFRETIAKEGVTMEDAIENIDIGGPSMLRSAAKNWKYVTVVCDSSDYPLVLDEITNSGDTTEQTRLRLSAKAYTHTAEYDSCIATYMRAQAGLNEKLFLPRNGEMLNQFRSLLHFGFPVDAVYNPIFLYTEIRDILDEMSFDCSLIGSQLAAAHDPAFHGIVLSLDFDSLAREEMRILRSLLANPEMPPEIIRIPIPCSIQERKKQ